MIVGYRSGERFLKKLSKYTEYHNDCDERSQSNDEMHVDPFFEEDPVKKIVFEERGKEPTVKDLSRQVGKINYENIFPEPEDFLQVNPFSDNKEEDPFREMFTSPESEDFIRNVPSFSLQDAFQNEGKYFGCPISERLACHSGNSPPGDIFLVNKEIERIKQELKKVDWNALSKDWRVEYRACKNCKLQLIDLDPYSDCSAENPLYLKKEWIDYLYNELGLSDRSIAQVCGTINHKTINKWRNTHGIQTRKEKSSYIDEPGYRVLLMPPDYKHPQLTYDASGRQVRREHIIVMEEHLAEYPEWDITKQCLIDNKYLDVECEVHHINQDRLGNRIENLWLYKTKSEHALVQQDLNTCFSGLIKLEQVIFDNGRYYINDNFDYRTIPPERIKEIIKTAEIEDWEDINKVREEIKKIDGDAVSQNWSIQQREGQNQSTRGRLRIIPLNPYLNCSLTNPLYKHKVWVERLVRDKRFNLTDSRLADLCNIGETTAYRWRWERHRNPTFHDQWGQYRAVYNGYSWIKLPKDYGNPYARKLKRSNTIREHRYVMEQYLSQHPKLSLYRDCLLNGKYLKTDLYCSSC